ncbi:DUF3488 and transglutaminase-like domain-containing protein [Nocardioides sp. KR10-350]|uniref:DUF3488 and transglutaminase-like domain-containing protein n=1 Tax=Nocardioides cheoyonin TaxID=3156615 RepID=UPI0032B57734
MPRLHGALVALVTWLTVLLALLSWRSFTADPPAYVVPSAVVGAIIVGVGYAGDLLRLRRPLALLAQVVIGGAATDVAVFGNPVPIGSGAREHVVDVFNTAYDTVMRAPLPVPVGDGGIAPYLILGAAAAFLLADLLVRALRRPPLAGLVLLAIFSVPFSIVGGGVAWWVFALTAAGFLGLLVLQESERVSRWGRRLDDRSVAGIAPDNGVLGSAFSAGPGAIGLVATALAVVVPVFVPTLHLDLSGFGPGGSGSGPIRVTNPTVGMYDDLRNQSDTALVDVRVTDGADVAPSYLRIATLTSFNGSEWSPGGRSIPPDHTARTRFSPPEGDAKLLGASSTYRLTATNEFDSRWLPTFYYTTQIEAAGDWRYDSDTLDFISGDTSNQLSTAGETWTLTAAPVSPSEQALLDAPFSTGGVPSLYTSLPDLPAQFGRIAREKTADQTSPFAKAVALQSWFHDSGEFRYSLNRPGGTGGNDLLHFVTDQKVGYCQQFATAMAAMARELGIPARVAVGFLHPVRASDGSYVFRGRDMHAWPELWFQGVGWVRFEPTPNGPGIDTDLPAYTIGVLGGDGTGTAPEATEAPSVGPTQTARPPRPGDLQQRGDQQGQADKDKADAGDHGHAGVIALVSVVGVLALGGVAVGVPLWVRLRRRSRRLAGGPEEGWAEIRDTARDLRLPWSDDLSPRASGRQLAASVIGEQARAALDRVVVAVERSRYARVASREPVGEDVRAVVEALAESADPRVRRRLLLWPRSVVAPRRRVRAVQQPEQVEHHLVDHMG